MGNLAVLVWTLLSSKSGGTGQNLLGFDLLQRIEAAIDTDEPASALQLPLFGLSSGDADQKAESVAAALTNRLRERVKAAFEAAGIEPALKEGVLKLMRPTGTALASGSDVQLEMVQMLAGWSANASSVMLMVRYYL